MIKSTETNTNKIHLSVTRIKTIMNSSSDAEKISAEATKLMAKAAELFIRKLAQEGQEQMDNEKKLDYKHLSRLVHNTDKYEFLREIMPMKITFKEYKEIIKN